MPREPWTHREEAVGGLRLHWVEAGQGPLVVLLHGFPEHWLAWRHQIPALAAAGFPGRRSRPSRLQPLRGNRRTSAATGWSSSPETSQISSGTWVTSGRIWSATTGGAIAWCVPALHPGLVERLAILNAPHPILFRKKLATLAQARRSSYVFFFQLPFFPERSLLRHRAGFLKRMLLRDPVTPGAFSTEEIEAYRDAFLRPGAATAAINYYRAAFRTGTRIPGLRRSLDGVPTLVLWGEGDRYLGSELLDGLETLSPISASSGFPTPATGSPPMRRSE